MKARRPYGRARSDNNNSIVYKALTTWGGGFSRDEFGVWHGHIHGLPVAAHDVSKLGGEFPDWLVSVSWMVVGLEVKEQRPQESKVGRKRELTDSEYYWSMLKESEKAYFLHSPMVKWIVASEEEVWVRVMDAVRFVEYVDSLPLSAEFMSIFFPQVDEETMQEKFEKIFEWSRNRAITPVVRAIAFLLLERKFMDGTIDPLGKSPVGFYREQLTKLSKFLNEEDKNE